DPEAVREAIRGDEIGALAARVAPIEEEQQREQLGRTIPRQGRSASDVEEIYQERAEQRHEQTQMKPRRRGIALWELALLAAGISGVVFLSEQMAQALEHGFLNGGSLGLNPFFVGFILLPLASHLVEFSAAISTAWNNRMETCLAVTAGSSIQTGLL